MTIVGLLMWPVWAIGIVGIGMLVDFNEEQEESHWVGGTLLSIAMVMLGTHLFGINLPALLANLDYALVAKYALVYVGIGLLWSFLRFYRLSKKIEPCKIKAADYNLSENNRVFRRLFERVPVWIAFWIPSMLWSSLSDLIAPFFEWVADVFKEVYIKLFEMATGGKLK